MWLLDDSPELVKIYSALYRIGIFANYKGFFYTARAVELCARQPERLQLITKWLYPEVAKRYGTNWKAVERGIRTGSGVMWSENRPLLEKITGRPLDGQLKAAQLLAILTTEVKKKGL